MPNTEIKLIATDLDGTLLRDDHLTLSPANREALTRAADAGIEVVVATGRSLAAVAPQVLELPFLHYFITCNGSITTDREGHILRAAPLPLDTTLEILEHLTTMGDFAVQLYADQKCISPVPIGNTAISSIFRHFISKRSFPVKKALSMI